MNKGFSLIEILVVVTIFAILATVAAQSTLLSLRSARKADSTADVRDSLDFAMSIMERQIRNAREISSACVGAPATRIDYIDADEAASFFACSGAPMKVSSGSAVAGTSLLTGGNVVITNCEFICNQPSIGVPPQISISLTGVRKDATGIDASSVTVDTQVNLRVY